jgi:ABC-type branched-subunit amino acid transport system ATPase component
LADRVYIMSKGQVVHQATPAELRDDHEVKSRFLGI